MVGCLYRLAHGRGVTARTTRKTRGRVRDDPPAAVRAVRIHVIHATGHNGDDGIPRACFPARVRKPLQWFACPGIWDHGFTGWRGRYQ